ncbi:tautomerase family protein [Sphingomonas morindae]|uniref:Tautomerase family protein n=1 Tax=Sphingomonas morindae TaxID=1541170 RepID=A0ABY4XAD5_9SPHN|nr:tautomerase family protein [Sphingomonas morindae]USI73915.1 tautomerase family protein [Sphingomonas morindae]
MPKMFVQAPAGAYDEAARARIARSLTDLGMTCERLADTEKVRAGVWVLFNEVAPGAAFSGGEIAATPIVALIVYALEGGLDESGRTKLIREATAILAADLPTDVPHSIYVSIQETPEVAWGMNGAQVSLASLRT